MATKYDRRAIMCDAARMMKLGMSRSDALRAAWAFAKSPSTCRQQEAGMKAALRRYGVNPDKIAERAKEAVATLVAAIDRKRPALLPAYSAKAIDLKRGVDGVYRI